MRVLAVVAHPDDEVLGVGATLAKHELAGDAVAVLIMGAGRGSLTDQRFDSKNILDIIRIVEAELGAGPEVVYTHSAADLNRDHRIIHESVRVACRPVPGCTVRRLLGFETPSATEWGMGTFAPSVFVDVAGEPWERKLKALECYASEMREAPHPRSFQSIEALATWRGSMAGLVKAEAFELVREVR